ncbi:MAG TPA: GNAT family N-acetyltransferase [Rhizomicrobium sp.]|nr:GNAT family N-acetyltransferase [Rhizomicrobium sp.]
MIPHLETERLILRGQRREDFPAHLAMWSDPRTLRHFDGHSYSEEDLWLRFARGIGLWALLGYGFWGIEEKASGLYIGSFGFFQAKRPLAGPWRDDPEAGWVIAPDHHGKGYARETLAAAMPWGDGNIAAPRTWCMINQGNEISVKVAVRAGYSEYGPADYSGSPVRIFTRPRAKS